MFILTLMILKIIHLAKQTKLVRTLYYYVYKCINLFIHTGDILTTMKKQFNVPDTAQCRIWHRVMTNRHRLMRNLQQELIDACIYKEQVS